MKGKTAIIIGAGPAGLTAAYELLNRSDIKPVVLEQTNHIGGISRTVNYKGNRMDIGGHRFFSKSDRIMQWWQSILPVQKAEAKDDALERGIADFSDLETKGVQPVPGPGQVDKVLLVRKRVSRIYYLKKFFDYPLSLRVRTLKNLGFTRLLFICFSYLQSVLFPIRPEGSLEDFLINRFGKVLYREFFKKYTEKVWGMPCSQISPDWGAQRIKGISVYRVIRHAFRRISSGNGNISQKGTETSLIEKFLYPKFGPGQLWEEVASIIEAKGGRILLNQEVVGLAADERAVRKVGTKNLQTGEIKWVEADYVFSTMPVKDLISRFRSPIPPEVKTVASGLCYRDFITVGLLLKKFSFGVNGAEHGKKGRIVDNWIYVQEKDVKLARMQIFNNWSPYLVNDPDNLWVGLEYFCNENDDMWKATDCDFAAFAIAELEEIAFIHAGDVLDYVVIRVPKAYPAYFGTYDRFNVIRNFLDRFDNLYLIGRNGMHRYNNMDHSMLTAMIAVESVLKGGFSKKHWEINTEKNYHEGP